MKFYMAPLEGITGYVFRNAHYEYFHPADKYFTPFITPGLNSSLKSKALKDVLPENNHGPFIVPQILTNGNGNPDRTSMTVIMYLNKHLYSKNYGMAGALSVILFIITAILSVAVFKYVTKDMVNVGEKKVKKAKGV